MPIHDLRIIFMGTPEFAVPSLEILVKNGCRVVAVVTAPDKPKGRGQEVATSAVKDAALRHSIPVLQPTNLKSADFITAVRAFDANLQVVVAFRMLPEVIWQMPLLGTFNLHASLLPDYRGAAPINWAIINGEKETGTTTFFLQHAIDTGNILFQEKEPITADDDAGSLYERLMITGAALVLKTVDHIAAGTYKEAPQMPKQEAKHAPKIFKETCKINWHQDADKVYNFIRGLSPYPAAWTVLNDKTCKIYKTSRTNLKDKSLAPGAYVSDDQTYLYFQTSTHLLSIEELQLEGKKKMKIDAFLRGNKVVQDQAK